MFCKKSGRTWVGATLIWALAGCASTSGEAVDQTTEDLGTDCANAEASAIFFQGFSFISQQTYSVLHCFKGQVYDVIKYDANVGASPAPALSTIVKWADATPTVSDCASAWVGSDLFEGSVGGGSATDWSYIGSQSGNGLVVRGRCSVPSVLWTDEMQPGHEYRVTASARTFNGSSAPTRMVLTQTMANGSPDNCLDATLDDASSCTVDSCEPSTGTVSHQSVPDGTQCCFDAKCMAGACTGGSGGSNGTGGGPCN